MLPRQVCISSSSVCLYEAQRNTVLITKFVNYFNFLTRCYGLVNLTWYFNNTTKQFLSLELTPTNFMEQNPS